MRGAILPLPNTPSWRGAHLKHRETLPFKMSFEIFASMKMEAARSSETLV
jgi:hypothetical protein